MSQTFVGNTRVPVTIVKAGPCVVTHVKTDEKDGYWAVQLGFGTRKTKNITKPLLGHLKGALKDKGKAPKFLKEVKVDVEPTVKIGDEIKVGDVVKSGDLVSITATSKGKGFAGVVKRWGFAGGPKTHGQSNRDRSPGSIGQGTSPGRVWKGKKMAGRMGNKTVLIKNLQVISVDNESGTLAISGGIPGARGGILTIKKTGSGGLMEDELKKDNKEPEKKDVKGNA